MMKRNKGKLILSSILILLPMLLGVFASDLLPETIAVHWGINGQPDGFMRASLFFYLLPPVWLALHWICLILSTVLNKNTKQSKKVEELVFWILPAISLGVCGMSFAVSTGVTENVFLFILPLLGIGFLVIGNYMPKTTRNPTMGIKIKWTLESDENWYVTHRFAGKCYVAVGLACFAAIPLSVLSLSAAVMPVVLIALIALGVVAPVIYSYRFYRRSLDKKENGEKGDNGS